MDTWNPWIDKNYVEHVPAWKVYLAETLAIVGAVFVGYIILVIYMGV